MDPIFDAKAHWLWTDAPQSDCYCLFRHSVFRSPEYGKIFIQISADSTFVVRCGGKRLIGGQYSDYPMQRSYSTLELTPLLKDGENLLEIEVHYTGRKFNNYLPGRPGVRAVVFSGKKILCATDESWECAVSANYVNGSRRIFAPPLGFIFEYDARKKTDFSAVPYLYPEKEYSPSLEPRPVPQLQELQIPATFLHSSGLLFRPREFADDPGACCEGDYLRPQNPEDCFQIPEKFKVNPNLLCFEENGEWITFNPLPENECANGRFLIVDLHQEEAGLFLMQLSAGAGTIVDISYGEHLDRGRVQTHRGQGGYNLADRYICKEGEQSFCYAHRRFGCRYIQLNFTRITAPVSIRYAGVIPQRLPLPREAEFRSEDGELEKIRSICKRTLILCMHEHYEDCPWREQALWNLDARIQMFIGYHLWGNYDYAASALELMRRSFANGFLASTQPGDSGGKVIPMFTLTYISAVWERLLFGGAWQGLDQHIGCVEKILDGLLTQKDGELYFLPPDPRRFWHFYEWQGILSRVEQFPQSPWNLFLIEALGAAAGLMRFAGSVALAEKYSCAAEKLGAAVEKTFREEKCYGIFPVGKNQDHYELIQFLMLAYAPVSEERRRILWETLKSGVLRPVTASSLLFMVQGMMECTPESRALCWRKMVEMYRPMMDAGSSTVWEVPEGSHDPGGLRSLCHAWSALLAAFQHRYLLGVRPLQPGFEKFAVKIYPGHLSHAEGQIPTPHGNIEIRWQKEKSGIAISAVVPRGCVLVRDEYPEFPVSRWNFAVKI